MIDDTPITIRVLTIASAFICALLLTFVTTWTLLDILTFNMGGQ